MQTNTTFGIIAGISIVVMLAGGLAFVLQPSEQKGDIFLINKGNSNSTDTTECFNVGTGSQIIKNSTDGNCYVRTLLGSPDISVTQQTNTITIDFNGTAGESTQCINIGSQTVIIKNSTSGNCYVKSITTTAKGITLTNSSDTLTISTNFANGTGILITGSTQQTFKTNFANGTGISITGTTSQTFTNTGVTSNSCTSPVSCSGSTGAVTISCPTCQTTITSSNTWVLLANDTATNALTTFTSSTFTGTKYIHIQIRLDTQTSSSAWGLRFNGDSGSNYGYRISFNGATDTAQTSQTSVVIGNSWATGENSYNNIFCANPFSGTEQKICDITYTSTDATPDRAEGGFVWTNTSNQITSVTVVRISGTGTLTTSSQIQVWGHN